MLLRRTSLFLFLFVSMILAGACSKKATKSAAVPPTPPPAPMATITAEPSEVEAGGEVQLTWATENATEIEIEGIGAVEGSGTRSMSPTESITYKVRAKGPGGQAEGSTRVTVNARAAEAPAATSDDEAFQRSVLPIYFDYDSYAVRNDQFERLDATAKFLREHPGFSLLIQGHTDERGSTEYNLALGDNRANVVKQALGRVGVADAKVSVVSFGKEQPFCTESSEACWQENRRVHFARQR